jgi:hypothetical protein
MRARELERWKKIQAQIACKFDEMKEKYYDHS